MKQKNSFFLSCAFSSAISFLILGVGIIALAVVIESFPITMLGIIFVAASMLILGELV